MASVGSASGSANYFAKDNYYSGEESTEASMWYGAGAEMLGLAPGEDGEIEPEIEAEPGEEPSDGDLPPGEELAEPGDDPGGDTAPEPDESGAAADEGAGKAKTTDIAAENPDDAAIAPSQTGEVDVSGDDAQPLQESAENADAAAGPEAAETRAEGSAERHAAELATDRPAIAVDLDSDIDLASLPQLDGPGPDAAVTSPGTDRPAGNMPLTNPSGRVDAATFENILNGKLPDGTQVGEPGKRVLGMDLTFSAPKSVSLLGLVGGDKRLIDANMKAVQATMRFAEKHFAEGRVKDGGAAVPVRTGNLVYALFAHDTSRALDPQAHVHAVIANVTRMPNGDWRSLHNGQLWKNNTVLGSIYNAALRENVEQLGYKVELAGKHGSFEIVGVTKEARSEFSQRREQILERAAALGVTTPEGMNTVTKDTRDPKINSPEHSALLAQWKERAAAIGFNPQALIDQSKMRVEGAHSWKTQGLEIAGSVHTSIARASAYMSPNADPLLSGRTTKLGLTVDDRTELAVAGGVRHLEQREAAFGVHQLTKAALDQGLPGVTPEGIAARVSALIREEKLVPGVTSRDDKQVTMLASAEALATEHSILANIDQGKGKVEPLIGADFAAEVLRGAAGDRDLNAGQLAAATSIISSPDRIVAIQGIAGAGKSTMLETAATVLKNYGKPVLGLAFQNKMVGDLAEGAGVEARTLASFLMPYERMIAENDRAGLGAARKAMGGSAVIVDEASMVSNKQMASLTNIANVLGLDKLVLVGDRQQLLSIDAGKSFALTQVRALTTRMLENLRQRTDEMKTVAALTNRGRASEALTVLGANVVSTKDRVGETTARWLALPLAERDRTMILTSGRATRGDLNTAIQSGLIAEGTLKGQGRTINVNEHVDRTREDLRHSRLYEPGLRLELWGDEKSLGLKRGEYQITRLLAGGKVQLERDNKKITIDPNKLNPARREDRMTMVATKEIKLHEGDKIRWTGNDKHRGIHNSAIGRVLAIDGKSIVVENADKSVVRLNAGDAMLRRIDLAYTLNMHMAQGVTTDKAMIVMGSEERFLSNQRLFNVGVTRARDGVIVITDDQTKLARQLDRTTGDKLSAAEVTGQISIDGTASRAPFAKVDLGPIPRDALDLAPRLVAPPATESASLAASLSSSEASEVANAPATLPPLPVPEKSKGLEL